ncbi:MAG: transcription antitermination factor NusB [Elusimicrobia bacterium]|jgi:N utilization substance protein B|nr:transcription antitermination factor NusB [Elusimicrobiota bacterium]
MGLRRQSREAALQILYLADVARLPCPEAATIIWAGANYPPKARRFADVLAAGSLAHRPEIDLLITRHADNWEISRMAAVDRNILRLATFELLFELDTPVSVVIDEAVEIAKSYSTVDSGKFVNGILDQIKASRPAPPPAVDPGSQRELFPT